MEQSIIQPGEKITFGMYHAKGKKKTSEPLTWTVLAVWDNNALILCDSLMAELPYNEAEGETDWKNCSLRKWLNAEFVMETFSNEESEMLDYSSSESDLTGEQDAVFILSHEETEQYLSDQTEETSGGIIRYPARCALKLGTTKTARDEYWWLRDIVGFDNRFGSMGACIDHNGCYVNKGTPTYCSRWIRPVCRIKLKK